MRDAHLSESARFAIHFLMITSPRIAVIVLLGLFLITGVAVGMPALEGVIKDANGRPLSGAEIRIETPESGSILKVVRTDSRGRYHCGDVSANTYRVSLVVNSAVKASIKNVAIAPTDPTQLNFELKEGKVMPQAKGKHYVWVPSSTGTNLAGRWVEVDEKGNISLAMEERIQRGSGGAIVKRIQENSGTVNYGR